MFYSEDFIYIILENLLIFHDINKHPKYLNLKSKQFEVLIGLNSTTIQIYQTIFTPSCMNLTNKVAMFTKTHDRKQTFEQEAPLYQLRKY